MDSFRHRRFWMVTGIVFVLVCIGIGVPIGRTLRQQSLDRMLIGAIRHNDASAVSELLRQGADANCHEAAARPPSFWQMLRARVTGKPILSSPTLTALLLATKPHEEFAELLDAPDYNENTLDNVAMIGALLEHGADPNARDPHGFTALLYAIRWQKHPAADLLLRKGANPDLGDKSETPLTVAIYMSDLDAMRLLMDRGARLDIQESVDGQTAIGLALILRKPACISLLMTRHPNLTIRDNNGKTPQEYFRELGYSDLLKSP